MKPFVHAGRQTVRLLLFTAALLLNQLAFGSSSISLVAPNDVATFHYDYGGSAINNNFACQYKSYNVTFAGSPASVTTTAAITSSSPTITLGPGETATKVWSNPSSPLTVFYYFCAASSAPTTTAYSITAADSTTSASYAGSLVPLNTIKAGNQTINSTSVSTSGGLVTITVNGTAANLNVANAGRVLEITPNVLKSWPAGALRLEGSTFKFTNQATTVTNRLSIAKSDITTGGTAYSDTYVATFTLRPVASNSGSGPIWPAAYNLSGNGLKHNDAAAYGISNTATLTPTQTTVSAAPPDLTVSTAQSPIPWVSNTSVKVTFTVSNVGSGSASGTTSLSITMPTANYYSTASVSSASGWSCGTPTAGSTFSCTRSDSLAPTASYPIVELTIPLNNALASGATTVPFSATVSNSADTNSSNDRNDFSAALTKGNYADPAVSYTVAPTTATRGQSTSFTVSVTNAGATKTGGGDTITASITIPADLTSITTSTTTTVSGWACSPASPAAGSTVTCSVTGQVGNTDTCTFTVNGTVSSTPTQGTLLSTATLSFSGGVSNALTTNDSKTVQAVIQGIDPAVYTSISPWHCALERQRGFRFGMAEARNTGWNLHHHLTRWRAVHHRSRGLPRS